MFIERSAFDKLPPDAIVLGEDEALNELEKRIYDYKPTSEIWSLKFGSSVLGGLNLLLTTSVGSYFRQRVKLPASGKVWFYAITAGTCGLATITAQQLNVQPDIILQKECSSCVHTRAIVVQLGVLGVYGVGFSAFITALAANNLNTYPIPGFFSWHQTKETVNEYRRFCKRIAPRLMAFGGLSAIVTYAIVDLQYKHFAIFNQKLYERDEKLRRHVAEMRAAKSRTS